MEKPTREQLIESLTAVYGSNVSIIKADRGVDITCPAHYARAIADGCTSQGLLVTDIFSVVGDPRRSHVRVFGFARRPRLIPKAPGVTVNGDEP